VIEDDGRIRSSDKGVFVNGKIAVLSTDPTASAKLAYISVFPHHLVSGIGIARPRYQAEVA
jgi:uncharacterized protein YhbP (UPF0306 family)